MKSSLSLFNIYVLYDIIGIIIYYYLLLLLISTIYYNYVILLIHLFMLYGKMGPGRAILIPERPGWVAILNSRAARTHLKEGHLISLLYHMRK